MRRARADARVLDEAYGVRTMTWIIGIMMFLTVLAASAGMATRSAARALEQDLAGRLTIQIVTADASQREAQAQRALAVVTALPTVARATRVDQAELARLLTPWLGNVGESPDLPMPILIEVALRNASEAAVTQVRQATRRVAADARVDRHEAWMSPVSSVLSLVTWLAVTLVVLMAGATAAVVVLAARAGLEAHRATIQVMHMLGSTDVQIARLFQRRIARDAVIGGGVGTVLAVLTAALVGMRVAALDSELLGSARIGAAGWAMLALLPIGFVVLAAAAARISVTAAMRRVL